MRTRGGERAALTVQKYLGRFNGQGETCGSGLWEVKGIRQRSSERPKGKRGERGGDRKAFYRDG